MESFEKIAKKIDLLNEQKVRSRNNSSSSMFLMGVTELFSGVTAGMALGFFLDSIFKTKFIFILICMCLGFIGAFLNIYRQIKGNK